MNTLSNAVPVSGKAITVRSRGARRARNHGALVIESLIGLFVGLLTGAALLALLQLTMTARSSAVGDVSSDEAARAQLETISDRLRNSQPVVSGSNTQCFSATAASDITCYTDSSGDTLRIWLNTSVSPAALQETQTTGGVATTTTLFTGVTSLQFYYYAGTSSSSSSSSSSGGLLSLLNLPLLSWLTTLNPQAPTAAEIPTLGAVKITLVTNVNGISRQLTSLVRFRNSPYT